jgi:hypothetical protein
MEFPDAAEYFLALVVAAVRGDDLAVIRERVEHIRLACVKRAGTNADQLRVIDEAVSAIETYFNSGKMGELASDKGNNVDRALHHLRTADRFEQRAHEPPRHQ